MAIQDFYDFTLKLMDKFRPGLRPWIVRTFIFAGIGTLVVPLWFPWTDAWIRKQLGIGIATAVDYTGWLLIAVGLILYFYNQHIEEKKKEKAKYDIKNKNTGIVGDHAHVEDGIHFTDARKIYNITA